MKKRISAFILAIMMLLSFASCAEKKDTPDEKDGQSEENGSGEFKGPLFIEELAYDYDLSEYITLPDHSALELTYNFVETTDEAVDTVIEEQLIADGTIKKDNITWGIMIETPSAALISDRLAEHVEFFSIGTNDLTQYTLAADRVNVETASYYDPMHPSVLKLIEITVENAKKAGVKVSVCGESAADAICAQKYIDIGIRNLSMAQNAMIPVKQHLLEKYRETN